MTKLWALFTRLPARTKLMILAGIAVIFTFAFPIISSIAGNRFGTAVGVAVGSFHAVTEDIPAAYSDGKRDGLSAEDTRGVIGNQIHEVGRLDVLAANARLIDKHEVGKKYRALYELGADVIFSVDVTKAKVLTGENTVEIILPKPEAVMNIDSTRTRLLTYSQRPIFDGSSKDGIDAILNTMKQTQGNAPDVLEGYAELAGQAEESARQQITMLVKMIVGDDVRVTVRFEEKAGEN